jgi:hypothetical protein
MTLKYIADKDRFVKICDSCGVQINLDKVKYLVIVEKFDPTLNDTIKYKKDICLDCGDTNIIDIVTW